MERKIATAMVITIARVGSNDQTKKTSPQTKNMSATSSRAGMHEIVGAMFHSFQASKRT